MGVWPKRPRVGADVKPAGFVALDYLVILAMATEGQGKPQMKLVHAGQ